MNVRLRHNMTFTTGIYYGGEVRMNNYVLTLHMLTNSTNPVGHNTAFERIKYFVYNKIDSSIFINYQYKEKCHQLLQAGLPVTTLPGEPVDQLVGLMLYYKLNAIMEDRILIEETEISSVLGENIIYLHSENENTDIEFVPDWWISPDPTHSDYLMSDADKIVNINLNKMWRELDLDWPESDVNTDQGNVVVFADFKTDHETK